MATTGYASALGSLAKDAVVGAGKGFVGGLKGAMISEAPGIAGAYAFGKELRSRANAPKMPSGGSAPPSATNKPSSSNSPMAGGLGTTNDKSIVAILRQSNIINLEQVRQLKQLNDNVINQSKLLKFTVDDTKRKDQFAEEVAKEQAFRDDKLLEAIKKIGGGFGSKGKAAAAGEGEGGGLRLGDLVGPKGALGGIAGGLAVLFRRQIASVLASVVASPLTGMAVNAAIAGGTFLATIGSGLAAALRIILTTALRALVTNPIGLAALGLGALFKTSRDTEAKQKKEAIDNNQAVAPMPTQTYENEAKQLREQARLEKDKAKQAELYNKAQLAQNKVNQERIAESPLSLANRQKDWKKDWDKTHNPDGTPKTAPPPPGSAPPAVTVPPVATAPVPKGQYRMPANGKVSSLQGMRDSTPHNGVDYEMPVGSHVTPVRPGKVLDFDPKGTTTSFGRYVIIDHEDGITSTYAHLSEVWVKAKKEQVAENSVLGKSGGARGDSGAGRSTNPHLHLEIKHGSKYLTIADLPGLEASGKLGATVSRNPAAPDNTAAGAASGLLPSAKPGTPSDYGRTMRPAGSSAAVPFGQESYNKHLLPENRPVPIEADAPYYRLQALIAEKNKKNDQLQGLDGKSPGPKVTEELINKLREDVKNLNEKIEDAKSLETVLDEAGFAMKTSVDAAMKRLGNLSPDQQKAVFSKMDSKEYEKELKKIFERIEGLKKLKDDPKKAKSEILNLIKDINKFFDNLFVPAKAPVVPKLGLSQSGVLGDGELSAEQRAKYGLDSPLFAKTNMLADPNANIVASLGSFLPNNTAGVKVVSKESNPFVALIERLFDNMHIDDLFRKEERNYRVASDASNKLASGTKVAKDETVNTYDARLNEQFEEFKGAKFGTGGGAKDLKTFVAPYTLRPTKKEPPFKPEFKSNSDILADANKQFLKELRSTLTGIFNTELNKALLPNGVGVSASEAGRDDMYRGEQLKKINDTSKKINEGAIDLFGKKFGPMFAPMLDKLSTSYFEVGARSVGKAIFQGIGNLGGKETMSLTGQFLGNYASGKKELAFEQLLYGMSGGQKSGVALGAETLFAKYGFKDPMEGISYYANALGEKATQYTGLPALMGADDRSKSIIFEPRSGKFLNVDTGKYATQPEIDAANKDYGSRVSQTPMIPSRYDNFGMPGAPYSTIAGERGGVGDNAYQTYQINNSAGVAGAGSVFKQVLNQKPGQETITRAQIARMSPEEFARGGDRTIAAQNTEWRAQAKLLNDQKDQTAKIAIEDAKLQHQIASKAASNDAEQAAADAALQTVLNDAKTSTDKINAEDIIAAVKRAAGNATESGSDTPGLKKSGRKSGQLFDSNTYDENGKIDGKDPMKEIGNFGFDMLKLAGGNALTKGIDNPYMKMIADFAIQKGMNAAIEAIMGTGGDGGIFSKIGSMFSGGGGGGGYGGYGGGEGGGSIFTTVLSFFGLKDGGLVQRRPDGGLVVGAGTGTSDSIPTMLSNGEFVVNAKAAAANMKLLDAINQSTLPKKTTSGSGTNIDRGGGDSMPNFFDGMTKEQQANYFEAHPTMATVNGLIDTIFGFTTLGSIVNFFDPMGKYERAAIRDGYSSYSNFKDSMSAVANAKIDAAKFTGLTGTAAKQAEHDAEKSGQHNTGKVGWGKTGDPEKDVGPQTIEGKTASLLGSMPESGKAGTPSGPSSPSGPAGERGGEHLAKGGLITGKGSGTSDSIFSMLSNGEFVINAKATKANLSILKQINSYTGSGSVSKSQSDSNLSITPTTFENKFKGFADGGLVTASTMNAVPRPTSRSPYILSPQTNNSSSENQNNSSNMIIGPKTSTRIDNSSVTNFYNQASGMIDSIRSVTPQVA